MGPVTVVVLPWVPSCRFGAGGEIRTFPEKAATHLRVTSGFCLTGNQPVTCDTTAMALDHSRPHWRVPKRIDDDAMLGGVASGLATELSVDAVLIRVGFVVLALAGGFGVIVYAAAFVVMQTRGVPDVVTPKATSPANAQLAVVMLLIGLMLLARSIGFPFSDSVMWPAVLLAGGVVFANDRGVDLGPRAGRWPWLTRFGGGAALVTMGVVLAVSLNFSLVAARDTLIVVGVVVAGLALVAAPTVARLARELTEERRERIRSDERADVAAHLHDSVLQTLSLIQRESADPNVVGLARQQERELRGWLFSPRATAEGSMRAQLEQMAADIERVHLVAGHSASHRPPEVLLRHVVPDALPRGFERVLLELDEGLGVHRPPGRTPDGDRR